MKTTYYESFIRLLLGGNFKWLLLIITAAKEDVRRRSTKSGKVMKGENQVKRVGVKRPQFRTPLTYFRRL